MRRQHWQVGKTPLAALDLVSLRCGNFNQMADSRGDDVLLVLKRVIQFLELTHARRECGGDVAGN